MLNRFHVLAACAAVSLPLGAASQVPAGQDSARTIRAEPVQSEIRLDGVLDEDAWRTAAVASDFVQQAPVPGGASSQSTEVRVLYSSDALYVGFRLFDSEPDAIAAQLARRDASGIYSDWAQILIDSYGDNRTAFSFSVNPRGVKRDMFHFADTNSDPSWDAVWDVGTRIDSLGWTAEFRIPFTQLRFDPTRTVWGINFAREIARGEEVAYWSAIPPDAAGFVSRFGKLEGLLGLRPARRLEVLPYAVARVVQAPVDAADPFRDRREASTAIGADVKYGLTSDFTLTATFNPDFGQVDADPAEVNLTAFETFLSERRPFFLEGTDIFSFGIDGGGQLFYSRRIGRAPTGFLPAGTRFADVPESTTILGAAKLSGKTSSGWSLGVLNAVTAEEHAPFISADGTRDRVVIEPLTNYAVARVIRDLRAGRTTLGAIATATHRQIESDNLEHLPHTAYSAGVDALHRFGGGNYQLRAHLLGSNVDGSTAALSRIQRASARYFQRPDADHLTFDPTRTTLGGWDARLHLNKIGGAWQWGLQTDVRSGGFEINDLGFLGTADRAVGRAYLGYSDFRPGPTFRRWGLFTNNSAGWTLDGEPVQRSLNANGFFQLRNFWGGGFELTQYLPAFSTTALRGGPALSTAGSVQAFLQLYTDRRKPVSSTLALSATGSGETDTWSYYVSPRIDARPSPRLNLSLTPSYYRFSTRAQYVAQRVVGETPQYFFARLDQATASLTVRLGYTLTPDLSLQFYAEPFIGAGAYDEFLLVNDPRARRFADRFSTIPASNIAYDEATGTYAFDLSGDGEPDASFGRPDFNSRQFRSNAVLRWEYRPGSTLFVVWSQGRSAFAADGRFRPGPDVADLFSGPSSNVLMLKLNYWIGL
jgi:hypothetical protein